MKIQTIQQQLTKDVQRDLMFQVILDMRHYKITMQQAQSLAKEFVTFFPVDDIHIFLHKLYELGKIYEEVRPVFIKYARSYYEMEKQDVLSQISSYIQQNDIDHALILAKGGTHHGRSN